MEGTGAPRVKGDDMWGVNGAVRQALNNFMPEIGLMSQIQEWGPHVWKILHYHAEYAGSSMLLTDEIRAWISLLKHTEAVLACAVCREHYKRWRTTHPIEEFLGKDKDTFRDLLRKWLWDLHESVNDQKDVPVEHRLPFEGLSVYKEMSRQDISQSVSTLKEVLQKAALYRQVNPIYVTEWLRALKFLQKLIF